MGDMLDNRLDGLRGFNFKTSVLAQPIDQSLELTVCAPSLLVVEVVAETLAAPGRGGLGVRVPVARHSTGRDSYRLATSCPGDVGHRRWRDRVAESAAGGREQAWVGVTREPGIHGAAPLGPVFRGHGPKWPGPGTPAALVDD